VLGGVRTTIDRGSILQASKPATATLDQNRIPGGANDPRNTASGDHRRRLCRPVVELRGLQFSGLLAWWIWLATHIFFLIGFRNRVSVLLNWALAYWTYQRGARIVLGQDRSAESPP